ncbi:MAG: helix-turn-helix domain-containing protein [Acidimicrobiales bacterium]
MEEVSIGEFSRRSRLSIKALRLYDELGVVVPARVDADSGYRYYDVSQLESARLVAMLRQLDFSLAEIKELIECEPSQIAERIAQQRRDADVTHEAQRELATYLINHLIGKRTTMPEIATREVPERSLLCQKRNVNTNGAWAFGKEFIALLRERQLPILDGREGAVLCIFWSEVSEDSDGPIEWCRPVPHADAEALAAQYPDLTLRTEPAHREAFIPMTVGIGGAAQQWQTSETLESWFEGQDFDPETLATKPGQLGIRINYVLHEPAPDCDFAVPFG